MGRRYRLWVIRKPKLVGEGASFEAAREALWGAVCTALGDGEAVFEFDPPEPMEDAVRRLRNPAIATIAGNTISEIVGDPNALFENGLCPECGTPRGRRTAVPLEVDSVESGYEGGFTRGRHLDFFSEEFVSLLTRSEQARFEWRPIQRGRRAKKVFYELIAEPGVPLVGMRGAAYRPLWECETCGSSASPTFFHGKGQYQALRDAGMYMFVSRADLPDPLPPWFIIGGPELSSLAVRQERWQQLVKKRGVRGLVSTPVGVLDPADVTHDFPRVKRSVVNKRNDQLMAQIRRMAAKHTS